jgi:hypothetical protein
MLLFLPFLFLFILFYPVILLNHINPIYQPPAQPPFLPARPPYLSHPAHTSQVRRRHPPQVPPSSKVQPPTRQGHVGCQRRVEGEVRDGRDRSVSPAARPCSEKGRRRCSRSRLVYGNETRSWGSGICEGWWMIPSSCWLQEKRKERKKRASGHLSLEREEIRAQLVGRQVFDRRSRKEMTCKLGEERRATPLPIGGYNVRRGRRNVALRAVMTIGRALVLLVHLVKTVVMRLKRPKLLVDVLICSFRPTFCTETLNTLSSERLTSTTPNTTTVLTR